MKLVSEIHEASSHCSAQCPAVPHPTTQFPLLIMKSSPLLSLTSHYSAVREREERLCLCCRFYVQCFQSSELAEFLFVSHFCYLSQRNSTFSLCQAADLAQSSLSGSRLCFHLRNRNSCVPCSTGTRVRRFKSSSSGYFC